MNYFTILHGSYLRNRIRSVCKSCNSYLSQQETRKGGFLRTISLLFLGLIIAVSVQAQAPIVHDISTGSLTISGTSNYVITGSTTTNRVIVSSGYKGSITLRNLTIKSETASHNTVGYSPFTVLGQYNCSNLAPITKVNIILEGKNELLYTGAGYACLQVDQGAQIEISAIDPNDNESGTLSAKATRFTPGSADIPIAGAGIGAPTANGLSETVCRQGTSSLSCGGTGNTAGGNIIISSGTITAWGGHASGIGGGYRTYYNGIVIVYGGIVEARGGYDSAGIGSGCPTGSGVLECYAENSTVIALPPAQIAAYGAGARPNGGVGTIQFPELGLTGTANITYINDTTKSLITVRTADFEPNANIYLDLTETDGLVDIFDALKINYDLAKVKIGKTAADGTLSFRAQLEQNTTFFTDASSTNTLHLGRPYMPVVTTVVGNKDNEVEVVLPLLGTDIAFTDYFSTPLEVGYTATKAREYAYTLKMEYKDAYPMTNVKFKIQGGTDFLPMIFLASDRSTVISAPAQLNAGDIYYIVLPIIQGKSMGIYSDVLLISGDWKGTPLPGYIRRVGEQRVVKNDTGSNKYIKVTANPDEKVFNHPTTSSDKVDLKLNIDHTGISVPYDASDVTAKYIITTEKEYAKALAATPLNSWTNLNIPATEKTDRITTVSFEGKTQGVYYIHWYVVSGVVYAHSQDVTSPPATYGGFGPYVVTSPVKAGTISGNPFVCAGQTPLEIKGEASTGGSGDFTYKWQMSINGGAPWTDVGGNTLNYSPAALTVSPTYYRRLTLDNKYGGTYESNTFTISFVNDGQALYWKTNTTDKNWNNPANWVNISGIAMNMVPVSCSNVFIPGGAANYPSLDANNTPVNVYGSPICQNITIAYGAELAYPHLLTYEKAKVQYNFGYYSTLTSGAQPTANKDGLSGISMKRGRWYLLAAPLKGMASGDFSFGGYPYTWQALGDIISGKDNLYSVDFDKNHPANDVDLATTNNSIVVKTAMYKTGVNTQGYNDHKHLQNLQGVLEFPYFDNESEAVYHPGHSYDPIAKRSTFYYFDNKTLQTLFSPVGRMKRSEEAHRFIFDNDIHTVNIGGKYVLCYIMKVSPNSTNRHALIGNPFTATINMGNFFKANSAVIETNPNSVYHVYDNSGAGDNGTWKSYNYTAANGVNSLQSFVVVFKTNAANQTLYFPLEGDYALTGTATNKIPRRMELPNALKVSVSNEDGIGGDYSELSPNISLYDTGSNVRKLVSGDDHVTPEVFFIDEKSAGYNLMQAYEAGQAEVGLGVRSSDTKNELMMTFDKVDEFVQAANVKPVLVDKLLGIKQDLIRNNVYRFRQQQAAANNSQYTDMKRFVVVFADPVEENVTTLDYINMVYSNSKLRVTTPLGIVNVKVYNLSGQLLADSGVMNGQETVYARDMALLQATYIVQVTTADGKIVSRKIMVNR